jgi:basic amino acid/polyamine antiporter, APA family
VSVLGPAALAASPRPLTDVMAHVFGDRGAAIVAAIAIVTTINTTLLALTAASRVLYGMARAGAMPKVFSRVHHRRRTPVPSIVALNQVSGLFAGLGDFAVYVVFLAVNGTVLILRHTRPRAPRPFAVAGTIGGVPLVPVLGFASVVVMMTRLEPRAIGLGLALCALGAAAGWWHHCVSPGR